MSPEDRQKDVAWITFQPFLRFYKRPLEIPILHRPPNPVSTLLEILDVYRDTGGPRRYNTVSTLLEILVRGVLRRA